MLLVGGIFSRQQVKQGIGGAMKTLDQSSEKFKNYEKKTETTLDPDQPIVYAWMVKR